MDLGDSGLGDSGDSGSGDSGSDSDSDSDPGDGPDDRRKLWRKLLPVGPDIKGPQVGKEEERKSKTNSLLEALQKYELPSTIEDIYFSESSPTNTKEIKAAAQEYFGMQKIYQQNKKVRGFTSNDFYEQKYRNSPTFREKFGEKEDRFDICMMLVSDVGEIIAQAKRVKRALEKPGNTSDVRSAFEEFKRNLEEFQNKNSLQDYSKRESIQRNIQAFKSASKKFEWKEETQLRDEIKEYNPLFNLEEKEKEGNEGNEGNEGERREQAVDLGDIQQKQQNRLNQIRKQNKQPQDQIRNEQPQDQIRNEQPQDQIRNEQPGNQIRNKQPGNQIKNEQPGNQIKNEQPGNQIKNEQPQDQIRNEQPGSQIRNKQPRNQQKKMPKRNTPKTQKNPSSNISDFDSNFEGMIKGATQPEGARQIAGFKNYLLHSSLDK